MQDYLRQTRLGSLMDGLGFHIFAFLASVGWFLFQWGLTWPSLVSGFALYLMTLSLRKKIRDDHLVRKEKQLRSAIGGELALERLLLSEKSKAHFEIAMLLSMRAPLVLLRADEEGVLCQYQGRRILVAFAPCPPSRAVEAEHVLALQRAAHSMQVGHCLLCAPCEISQRAMEQSFNGPRVFFLSREKLLSLLGSVNPATDEQLVALGKRRRSAAAPKRLFHLILNEGKARRYACYGGLLLIMYQFTHLIYYAAPGLVCVFLAAACRCVRRKDDLLPDFPV